MRTAGVGAWIRYGGPLRDGEVEWAARHYRTAVLQPWETDAARRLKDARPDMTVLAYRCLSSVRLFEPPERCASGIGWQQARERGWIARCGGEMVEWDTYPGHFQARVWDPAYREAWTERVASSLEGTAFDGVMADNDVFEDYYGVDLSAIAATDPDAPADAAGMRAALGALVEQAGGALAASGRLLVPNIAEARREPGRWRRHAAWGGGFDECWLGWGDDVMFDAATAAAQAEQLAGPGLGLLRTPSGGSGPAHDGSRRGMYGLAVFWIVGAGAPQLSYAATGHDDYSRTAWFPAMDADLGRPLGPVRRSGRVWRRRFEGGVAAAILDGEVGGTVTLPTGAVRPGPQGRPDGDALPRRLRLRPHEGVIALTP
ncbi:putative glycoside hydrolase [Actinomyces sp.]|uniref:putative glycoside hydrolase n=1 Tax=Actinomyces sp. TaxID=29317 RepID=UPI0026DD39DB|nr:putative glycoside hydrolase [Actinomyces sp.]MDO4901537.1 putative glycoside hydrolase [Actinomyces sp.]